MLQFNRLVFILQTTKGKAIRNFVGNSCYELSNHIGQVIHIGIRYLVTIEIFFEKENTRNCKYKFKQTERLFQEFFTLREGLSPIGQTVFRICSTNIYEYIAFFTLFIQMI